MTLNKFDPRARILFYLCLTSAIVFVNDLRWLAGFMVIGLGCLWLAHIPFKRTRQIWITIAVFTVFITATNLLFRTPTEAAQQFMRTVAMTGISLGILLSFDTGDIGVAFRQLGLPDRFAYTLDLTARFVPTLARDFRNTIDAQKARGYELEARDRSLKSIFTAGRRVIPLFVPVIVRAVLDAEDTTNAMDLRAFGTQPRTWLRVLHYHWWDYLLITAGVLVLIAVIAFFVRVRI